MRPQRLSYQTIGAAVPSRGESPSVLRASVLTVASPADKPSFQYGKSPGQVRQRRIVIAAMLAVHAVAVVGLLQATLLHDKVVDPKPVFLAVVDAPAPVVSSKPLPLPSSLKMPAPSSLPIPLIAPEPSPSPSPMTALAVVSLSEPAVPAAEPLKAPAPTAPLPRTIPPSAVQYLVPPAPVYSRVSAKMREAGKALIRVYIDESGMPRNVQIAISTGFARLDDAALMAVRNCRFKPYLENGVAVSGWAAIPIEFELPT